MVRQRNTEICEELTVSNVVEEINTYRERWEDHVARMGEHTWLK
jgi:hypothetical protein